MDCVIFGVGGVELDWEVFEVEKQLVVGGEEVCGD